MATARLYLDARRLNKTGMYPVKIMVNHKDDTKLFPTGISVKQADWNANTNFIRKQHKEYAEIAAKLNEMTYRCSSYISTNQIGIKSMNCTELRDTLELYIKDGSVSSEVISFWKIRIEAKNAIGKYGTADWYSDGLTAFTRFIGNHRIRFAEINVSLIETYEAHLVKRKGKGGEDDKKPISLNTVNGYMRSFRAIINDAVKKGKAKDNPFNMYKIKKQETKKRAISEVDIQLIRDAQIEPGCPIYDCRNYFLFSFNMRGMNFKDMAFLKKEDIVDDRIEYKRLKQGSLFSIKITKEAKGILDYYKDNPGEYVFPILYPNKWDNKAKKEVPRTSKEMQRYYRNQCTYHNKRLKGLADFAKIEATLTGYVSRHSWATLAKKKGVPIAVISEGLGHGSESVTKAYLGTFDNDYMDKMNDLIVGS